jgi:hypothetical protein
VPYVHKSSMQNRAVTYLNRPRKPVLKPKSYAQNRTAT